MSARVDVDKMRDELARDAMRELLRGSAVGQVIEEAATVGGIAVTAYAVADAMLRARSVQAKPNG